MYYAKRGFPFSEQQLCTMAYDLAKQEGCVGFSPLKARAGRNWLKKGFYKRHPEVRKKMAVNLSIAQAIYANSGQIDKFFNEYKDWITQWGLDYRPNLIWNTDECGVSDVPKSRAVVGVTGEQTFQTVCNDKGENTTIVSYVSAGGVAMPPFIIFKCGKVKTEWREAAPSGYYLRRSETGFINSDLFYESAEKFVEFIKEKKILGGQDRALLLLDLHRSHLFNLKFLEYMKANRVEVCSFPPHCTHLMQPLDDVPFGSFKIEYQKSLLRINRLIYGQKMSKATFFRAFVPAYSSAMTPEIIRKGWKNTGLMPIDRDAPKLQLTEPSAVYDRCKLSLGGGLGDSF